MHWILRSLDSEIKHLLSYITLFTHYKQWTMAMCHHQGHPYSPVSKICGFIHIQPFNHVRNNDIQRQIIQYLRFIDLLKNYTLYLRVYHLEITWTPNCEVSHLEITRGYEDISVSRYCGYHPTWNESSPMSNITLAVKTVISDHVFDVKLSYFLGKSRRWILYKRRLVDRFPFEITIMSLSRVLGNKAFFFTSISQYTSIIKVYFKTVLLKDVHIQFMMGQD